MNILVTGGAGFIGSHVVRYLINQTPHQVTNLDKLTYAGSLNSLADVEHHQRYRFVNADVTDSEAMRAVFRDTQPGAVIHLAAESHVDRSIDSPEVFIQTNIVGTYRLLEAARNYLESLNQQQQSLFRLLHVSTDEVYGSLTLESPPATENTRYAPHSPYSASKAAADHLVGAWHTTFGLPTLVTHCSNNYGPFQFPEKLIPVVILKAIRGEPIPVYGDGENVRDWLYVEDHADALYQVLTRGSVNQVYHISGKQPKRNIELVHAICDILDELIPVSSNMHFTQDGSNPEHSSYRQLVTFVRDRPGHDLRYAMDASTIESELGWHARQPLGDGLKKTVRWYLDHLDWCQSMLSPGSQDKEQSIAVAQLNLSN